LLFYFIIYSETLFEMAKQYRQACGARTLRELNEQDVVIGVRQMIEQRAAASATAAVSAVVVVVCVCVIRLIFVVHKESFFILYNLPIYISFVKAFHTFTAIDTME
jgi:hypothetical protein